MAVDAESDLGRPLDDQLNRLAGRIGYWYPSAPSPRMPAQAGFLAWSAVEDHLWGSFGSNIVLSTPTPSTSLVARGIVAIAISPDLKAFLRDRWSTLGLSVERLFPDFDGFANANGVRQPLQSWYYG